MGESGDESLSLEKRRGERRERGRERGAGGEEEKSSSGAPRMTPQGIAHETLPEGLYAA